MLRKPVFILAQYLLPQHFLSRVFGFIAKIKITPVKNAFIKWFIKRYNIDLSEAIESDYQAYSSFSDFFIRALKPNARPISRNPNIVVSPVDGTLSQIGMIHHDTLLQAKGIHYNLKGLVGPQMSEQFERGNFATIYLAPYNYHRVHMPYAGTFEKMIYIPGKLFSVNPETVDHIPQLFSKNERLVALFKTDLGPMAVIFVGALLVGGIHTHPLTPGFNFQKGEELGYFNFGSTVIVLFGSCTMNWDKNLCAQSTVKMGEEIGTKLLST